MTKSKPFSGKKTDQSFGAQGDHETDPLPIIVLGNLPAVVGVYGEIEFKIIGDQVKAYARIVYKAGILSLVLEKSQIPVGLHPSPDIGTGIGGGDPIVGKGILELGFEAPFRDDDLLAIDSRTLRTPQIGEVEHIVRGPVQGEAEIIGFRFVPQKFSRIEPENQLSVALVEFAVFQFKGQFGEIVGMLGIHEP